MKHNLFTLVALAFSFLLVSPVFGSTFHAIVVIQDTAPGSVKDRAAVKRELAEITRLTDMELQLHEFNRSDESIVSLISSLSVGSDDVLMYYYSGHGQNAGDGWPVYNNAAGNFKMTRIHDKMASKNARLTITIFDSCNINATEEAAPHIRVGVRNLAMNYALMYKQTSGQIKITSSSDGNFSYGSEVFGGFFTSSFFNAVHNYESNAEQSQHQIWEEILNQSKITTNQLCIQSGKTPQTPKYELAIRTNGIEVIDAPDLIIIGKDGQYNFSSFEEIVAYFARTPEHRGLTIAQLKAWNPNVTVRKGESIQLVEPSTEDAF